MIEAGSLGRLEVTNVSRIVALDAPSIVFYNVWRLQEVQIFTAW